MTRRNVPNPIATADLPALFERALERALAVRNLFLHGLGGDPVHISRAAFKRREAHLCSAHPLTGLTTSAQFRAHLRRHHPTDLDVCPHCGWDMRLIDVDPFGAFALPSPLPVMVIQGVKTHVALWQGTVRFQFANHVCPRCRREVVR